MYTPKVSIIIPVYNGANYLSEAIDSALAQTYKNIEILVVNDGSGDDGATEKVALSYGDKIRYFKKENGGVSSALNLGIQNMEGEYFSWLSHDDLYLPEKIEEQIKDVNNLISNGKDYKHIMCYCCGGHIDASGMPINKSNPHKFRQGCYNGKDALFMLFKGATIGGCGMLIPKQMFKDIGLFDERMRFMQDVFMWEKAFLGGYDFYVNDRPMSITRIHGQQTSSTGRNFGMHDREIVGEYLIENLNDLRNSKGKLVAKQYLLLCARNNSTNISDKLYLKLKNLGYMSNIDKLHYMCVHGYGLLRRVIVSMYYALRFNVKR